MKWGYLHSLLPFLWRCIDMLPSSRPPGRRIFSQFEHLYSETFIISIHPRPPSPDLSWWREGGQPLWWWWRHCSRTLLSGSWSIWQHSHQRNQIEPSHSRWFTQAVVLSCGQCVEGGDDGGDGDDVRHDLLCCDADCRDWLGPARWWRQRPADWVQSLQSRVSWLSMNY